MAARFIVQVSDDADYKDAVLDAPRGTLCVVDVYASWCGPCDALNKKITNLYQDNTECAAAVVAAPPPPAPPPLPPTRTAAPAPSLPPPGAAASMRAYMFSGLRSPSSLACLMRSES